jgi:hypothetical protein
MTLIGGQKHDKIALLRDIVDMKVRTQAAGIFKKIVFLIPSSWFHTRAVFSQFPVHFPTVPDRAISPPPPPMIVNNHHPCHCDNII